MSYITTASSAAACAFPYFSRLKIFPRSIGISEAKTITPLFHSNNYFISYMSSPGDLVMPPSETGAGIVKKHTELPKFSISKDLMNRFRQNFD